MTLLSSEPRWHSDRDRPVMTCSFANKCIHTQSLGTGDYLFILILTFDILRDEGKRKIFTNFICFTEYLWFQGNSSSPSSGIVQPW